MSKIKHVFFDLDRTLWDFESNSKSALEQLFEELKLRDHLESFEAFHHTYKQINADWWNQYRKGQVQKEALRVGRFSETLNRFKIENESLALELANRYVEVSPYQTNLFPGTIETLEALKRENHALHIITNGFKEVQFVKLKNSRLIHFFDDVLCSEEVGANKPDPHVFRSALQRTGAKSEESMMVGDDFEADVLGAEKCGIKGVLFDPHDHFQENNAVRKIRFLQEIRSIVVGL
ncbi:MAG: YjjG family noncanonical pyrimidine nucleotidase [Bacteroidota bacterium]